MNDSTNPTIYFSSYVSGQDYFIYSYISGFFPQSYNGAELLAN